MCTPKSLKKVGYGSILRISVKDGENIAKVLRVYKRKFIRTQTKNRVQENKQFAKPSVAKREPVQKAQYGQKLRDAANA